MLKNNVNVFKKKNIELINDDYLNKEKKYKNNLVFFDPPWSGIYYKIEESIDLYLRNKNIRDCPRSKSILKAPHNFNVSGLENVIVEKSIYHLLIIKK